MTKINGAHKIVITEKEYGCTVAIYEQTRKGYTLLGCEDWANTEEAKEEYGF